MTWSCHAVRSTTGGNYRFSYYDDDGDLDNSRVAVEVTPDGDVTRVEGGKVPDEVTQHAVTKATNIRDDVFGSV